MPKLARMGMLLALVSTTAGADSKPSFDCTKVEKGSAEAIVCEDAALAALDRKLAEVFAAASAKATNEHPPALKAEHRGWIRGRDDCWKDADQRACIEREYVRRIAELQARYRLVAMRGPVTFRCTGGTGGDVVMTYFETDPPTAIAEYGDSTSLMFAAPAASGAKYEGRNESFWEHQGEAKVRWGYEAPEMTCAKQP